MQIRRILLALPVFALTAFIPVLYFSDKKVWAPVWLAYPGFFVMLDGKGDALYFAGLCVVVIAGHIALSIGAAIILDRILFRKKM
jgi:hypothetical protein